MRCASRSYPLAIAVLAAVISGAWASRPSLWFDEGATIRFSQPDIARAMESAGHIDAAHGLYSVDAWLVRHISAHRNYGRGFPAAWPLSAAAGVVVFTNSFRDAPRRCAACSRFCPG